MNETAGGVFNLPRSFNSTHNHLGLYQATLGTRAPPPLHATHPPCVRLSKVLQKVP